MQINIYLGIKLTMKKYNLTFKYIIVLFWCIWWLLAFWRDVVGAAAHLQILQANWAPDVNYPFLVQSLQMYNVYTWVPAFFYIGIIILSGICFLLFFRASCYKYNKKKADWLKHVNIAFIVSTVYWLLFFLADQVVMKFDLEENHMVQGGFSLLCYLAIYILPD
ncbi:MAG: Uncharacterized protein K0R14_274 [Burkholderiales bacterium]|jgi:hypothetical protein|nr:Uncharacterized protein [Burkholderiales bacterium]